MTSLEQRLPRCTFSREAAYIEIYKECIRLLRYPRRFLISLRRDNLPVNPHNLKRLTKSQIEASIRRCTQIKTKMRYVEYALSGLNLVYRVKFYNFLRDMQVKRMQTKQQILSSISSKCLAEVTPKTERVEEQVQRQHTARW
ncbi:unnamed protein product [Dicrocoelium dendriticum]|nr:unnamed protein product [Dicrocoelium dendriticum]